MLDSRYKTGFVSLNRLRFHAHHGVLPQERVTGGDFIVNVRAEYPILKAAKSDRVEDTLNYATMYDIIKKEMQTPSNLLEHVAGRIGEAVFEAMPAVVSLDIKIEKLNPPMSGDIGSAAVELHLINNKTI